MEEFFIADYSLVLLAQYFTYTFVYFFDLITPLYVINLFYRCINQFDSIQFKSGLINQKSNCTDIQNYNRYLTSGGLPGQCIWEAWG